MVATLVPTRLRGVLLRATVLRNVAWRDQPCVCIRRQVVRAHLYWAARAEAHAPRWCPRTLSQTTATRIAGITSPNGPPLGCTRPLVVQALSCWEALPTMMSPHWSR